MKHSIYGIEVYVCEMEVFLIDYLINNQDIYGT